MTILIVSQTSVAGPMAEVAAQLVPGHPVRFTDADAFNVAQAREPGVAMLLVSNAARCSRAQLVRFPDLIAVVFIASGTESIDLAAATQRGIVVAHGHSDENADSMAEATVMMMLAALYDLRRAEQLLRQHLPPPAAFSRMLQGRVIGLIGYGKIARGVVARLQGWGARFLVATRSTPVAIQDGVKVVALEALMAESDVVSVHAGLNEGSRRMIGERELRLMRRGSVFINTGRGGLVDEDALARCALDQELWLGLDTFEREPLPAESPLRGLPRTILTPHLVGHTMEAKDSLVRAAVANIQRLSRGEAPLHARNWAQVAAA